MESIVKMGFKTVPENRDNNQAYDKSPQGQRPEQENSEQAFCAGTAGSAGSGEGFLAAAPAGAASGAADGKAAKAPAGRHSAGGALEKTREGFGGSSVPPAAAEPKNSFERRRISPEERVLYRSRTRHYRLIARFVIVTVVVSYLLIRAADNLGPILTSIAKAINMVIMLLKPLFWGFILAYILAPAVSFFENRFRRVRFFRKNKKRLRGAAVAVTCVLSFLVVGALLSLLVSAVTRSVKVASLEDLILLIQSLAKTLRSFRQTLLNWLAEMNIESSRVAAAMKQVGEKLAGITSGLSRGLTGTIGQIGGFLTSALFAVIFSIYFLLDGRGIVRYWTRVLVAAGGKKARKTVRILADDADAVFSGYIRGQLIDALFMAVIVSVALSFIGVQYAVIIGVLSGLGNLIPYLGPVVAYGSTILVCLLSGDIKRLLIAIVILFVIQTVDGNVINPRLLSSNIDVHPMLVIASLIVGGAVGGIVGMLFAVPVAAFFKIQFDKLIDHILLIKREELESGARKKKKKKTGGSGNRKKRSQAGSVSVKR